MNEVLNDKLNEVISELFRKMIKASDKIVSVKEGTINYDNGLVIELANRRLADGNEILSSKEVCSEISFIAFWETDLDVEKVTFYIKTPYRYYVVPEITNRIEYAEVLNTLDESLRQFEKRMLSKYIDYFDNY